MPRPLLFTCTSQSSIILLAGPVKSEEATRSTIMTIAACAGSRDALTGMSPIVTAASARQRIKHLPTDCMRSETAPHMGGAMMLDAVHSDVTMPICPAPSLSDCKSTVLKSPDAMQIL